MLEASDLWNSSYLKIMHVSLKESCIMAETMCCFVQSVGARRAVLVRTIDSR